MQALTYASALVPGPSYGRVSRCALAIPGQRESECLVAYDLEPRQLHDPGVVSCQVHESTVRERERCRARRDPNDFGSGIETAEVGVARNVLMTGWAGGIRYRSWL